MSEESDFGESIKFYSDGQRDPVKRTGLNVQYTMTKANYPTVSIEVAPISMPRSSPNWEKKNNSAAYQGRVERSLWCVVWSPKGGYWVLPRGRQ